MSSNPMPSRSAPARPGVPRPIYREPAPARAGSVLLGTAAGALWMLLFGLLAHSARGFVWWSIVAGLAGFLAALVLARFGDRGIATGVAITTGLGIAIAFSVVVAQAIGGHWVLW